MIIQKLMSTLISLQMMVKKVLLHNFAELLQYQSSMLEVNKYLDFVEDERAAVRLRRTAAIASKLLFGIDF